MGGGSSAFLIEPAERGNFLDSFQYITFCSPALEFRGPFDLQIISVKYSQGRTTAASAKITTLPILCCFPPVTEIYCSYQTSPQEFPKGKLLQINVVKSSRLCGAGRGGGDDED